MNDEAGRPRLRMDLPEDIIRTVRARAGEDGVSPNDVICAALEIYLRDDLIRIRAKMKAANGTGVAKIRKGKDD